MPQVAPTSVTPASGATVTVPNPTLGATLVAIGDGTTQKAEWQFATNSGFTTNVITVTETNADLRVSGATTEAPSITDLALTNGTWYIRARSVTGAGVTGPYNTGVSFTVNVPILPTPTALTPATGTVTTMTPTLGVTLGVDGAGRQQKAEWQLATNTGFTANVRAIIESDTDFRASGATTEVVPAGSKITYDLGTTWYLRARSVGNDGTTSAWTANNTLTLSMAAPPTPTSITPANGSTQTTSEPTLGATLSAATEGRTVKAEWQLATDSGFTANVKTITESSSDLRTSGATTEVVPTGSKLYQTLWYMRSRAIDQYGQPGSYSANQSFTVAHAPVASPTSPIADSNVIYSATPTFTWGFSDPYSGDTQTAYQIIIERNDTAAVVTDTGKISSTAQTANVAVNSSYKDIKLRWKIRVWDSDNVPGNYSPYQLFTVTDVPTVTVTAPTNNQVIATGAPTVTWTLDAGTTQVSYRIVFRKQSDNSLVYDTGTVNSTSLTYTAPLTILPNSTAYTLTVTVTDTMGLSGDGVRNFSVSYSAPATVPFTVDDSGYDGYGYVNINWSGATPAGNFIRWNVYRKTEGTANWAIIYTTTNVSIVSYKDYLSPNGEPVRYAVTQVATVSASPYESAIVQSNVVQPGGTHYWLISPTDPTANLLIPQVVGDDFTDEYEQESYTVIGRGRKVNQGTRIGYSGELSTQLRTDSNSTAREKRLKLELLKATGAEFYLRTPFGDVFQIALGNLSFSRIAGVGTNEYMDVSIPYMEVF
ncbi:MAG TPA: hypothetical protein VIY48_12600 [Candidatus Paceibacterota bacterium]